MRVENNLSLDGLARSRANQLAFAKSSKLLEVTLDRPNSKLTAASEAESVTFELSIGFAFFFTRAIELQSKAARKHISGD
jgi:hypothetical protein